MNATAQSVASAMQTRPEAGPGNGGWDPDDWDSLIAQIHNGNVVAVVGPELCTVTEQGKQVPLYPKLLRQLESALKLEPPASPRSSLHDVTCDYLQSNPRKRTEDVLSSLCGLSQALAAEPPPALCALAEVWGLRLFVTTTPDKLLEAAIDRVRFQGRRGVSSLVMSLNSAKDLPKPYEDLSDPVVFHPFGELVPRQNACVISDEDLLEFFFHMQGAVPALNLLFDALRENQLLCIGNTFADWVMRFFLRTAHDKQRLKLKEQRDYIVGKHLTEDRHFVRFMQLFARDTIISAQDPVAFAFELRDRWLRQHPAPTGARRTPTPVEMPDGAIFLSYAREDRQRVEQLKAGLEEGGLVVWFDADQLMAGDTWDHKIQENLTRCDFFCPCISRHTEAQAAGFNRYFREEWRQAADIARRSDHAYEYIIPVLLDSLDSEPKAVPNEFSQRQMVKAIDGQVSAEFRQRMLSLVARRKEPADGA